MKTLFGITLERFQKGVGLEALRKHIAEFKATKEFDFGFYEYDSLYDRRLDELKYALLIKYNNTLNTEINSLNKFNGIKRIVTIGDLEKIKDFDKMVEGNNFLNRPKITEENKISKRYRIYREKNDTIKTLIKDMWNSTVKKFCEKWLREFDEKTLLTNEFYSLLVNLKNLKGFEMKDYEKFRSNEMERIKASFLKFLTNYDEKELGLREIISNYFKNKKDYSLIPIKNISDTISTKLYSNLKDLFKNKFQMNEEDIKNKVLKNDIFEDRFDFWFKDLVNKIAKEKISENLLKENNCFALLIGDDIYILNKKTCTLPIIYTKGDEELVDILAEYKLKDEKDSIGCRLAIPESCECKDLLAEFIIEEDGNDKFYLNNFDIISRLEWLKLDIEYVDSRELSKQGKVSFLNLPQLDDEFIVDENNFLEVVRKLNKNFKYNVEEL